jgi:hypothetical protein
MILAIDPGNIESACTLVDEAYKPVMFAKMPNDEMLKTIGKYANANTPVVIEMIACYGMAVGKEVFETCLWIGRFSQAAIMAGAMVEYMYRKDVKIALCNSTKAKDANIRQALIDRFGVVGTKKAPGYFYGFKLIYGQVTPWAWRIWIKKILKIG